MPGPILRQSPFPWWADPKGASVFDVPGQGMLRQLVGWLGLDDPTQIMGLGVPIETGAATGGVLDLLAQKFPRLANAIKAYHGSPHDFERFDMSKIGTGEGAQAYGHGLYFAEKEGTAQSYRDALGTPTLKLKGQDLPPATIGRDYLKLTDAQMRDEAAHDLLKRAQKNMRFGVSADDIVEYAKGEARVLAGMKNTDRSHWLAVEKAIEDMRPHLQTNTGRMYEVAIHADPDQFLDWDKSLSQQHPEVKKALERVYPGVTTGDFANHTLQNYARNGINQRMAEVLKSEGIPGIKYLDQGSRTEGKGTYNYVVFDDRLVEILKKYGIAVTTAAGLADLQRQQQAKP